MSRPENFPTTSIYKAYRYAAKEMHSLLTSKNIKIIEEIPYVKATSIYTRHHFIIITEDISFLKHHTLVRSISKH